MLSEALVDATPAAPILPDHHHEDSAAPTVATPTCPTRQVVQKIRFYMNDFLMEKDFVDLPATAKEFAELAEMVPNGRKLSGTVRVVSFLGEPGGPPEVSMLRDRDEIAAFWRKVINQAGSTKEVSVSVMSEKGSSYFHYQSKYVGLFLLAVAAIWNPTLLSLLPADMKPVAVVGREAVAFFGQHERSEKPKDQMTNFALANVQSAESPGTQFLEGTLMQSARTYAKSVLFETESKNKHHAVINALANTNLDPAVSLKIGALVGNTTLLVDQFSDFIYKEDGQATTFTVNLWVNPKKTSEDKVEVALMVSGASFKKATVKAVQEVEEQQFREYKVYHEATWRKAAYVEHIKEPLTVDGITPLVRKIQRPIFDQTSIKANEMEILRSYLMTLASHDTLRNYAPHKMPLTLKRNPATMPLPVEPHTSTMGTEQPSKDEKTSKNP